MAARVLFGPNGLRRIRQRAVSALGVVPGARVLEIGCGPGELTRALLSRGAQVHAVDASADMIAAARRVAPGASYECSAAASFVPLGKFDGILLSFLLHEIPTSDIGPLLATLHAALVPHGRLVIVDHSLPNGWPGRTWHAVLRLVESRAVDGWLRFDLMACLSSTGYRLVTGEKLAHGRAQVLVAEA